MPSWNSPWRTRERALPRSTSSTSSSPSSAAAREERDWVCPSCSGSWRPMEGASRPPTEPRGAPSSRSACRWCRPCGRLPPRMSMTDVPGEVRPWRGRGGVVEDVAAYRSNVVNYTGGGFPEQLRASQVSRSYFHLFGAPLERGRVFSPDEDRPGGDRVAVLSHALWNRRF